MKSLKAWKEQGDFFLYKSGYPVFYRETGKGDSLLLLHGFPTASWDWQALWDKLQEKFHVIAPDFMGFGFSAKPRFYHYSILDQADLIEHLLEQKKVKNVHVLAHDYGDTVLQELLARFLEREKKGEEGIVLKSVCLLNGGLFPETHQPLLIQKLLISPVGLLLTPFLNKKKLKRSFENIFGKDTQPTQNEIDDFYALMSYNRGKFIFHKLIRYMAERKQYRERWVGALQQAGIPIRLINGGADPISGKHMAERYQELIPNPDIILLDEVGHYPQVEAPETVWQHFWTFVASGQS